jgi:lysine-N-methylase
MLPLELPTIQNWSCHNCGGCCRQHAIAITEEERQRIIAQNWSASDGIPAGQPLFASAGGLPWRRTHRLAHRADGACVFLDERGLCRIHARFGEAAKPLACRVYPYALHPAGKKIVVSLRYSCPSVVANRGRSLSEQKKDLREIERLIVPEGAERFPPPQISPGQRLDWPDTLRFVSQLDDMLSDTSAPVVVRLMAAMRTVELIGQSRFEKVRGERLDEFLELVAEAGAVETPHDPAAVAEPTPLARTQFRMLAAQYARKDTFAEAQLGWRHRWRLFRAALRFARGTGLVPPLQEGFVEVPFADLERPYGPLTPEIDELFTRYLRVKIQGLHFFGPAYYDVPLVEGFQSLALVYPVVLWMSRWLAAGAGRMQLTFDDVARALAVADHHHGYSPAFGGSGFRGRVRLLARTGEIARLAAWYSR